MKALVRLSNKTEVAIRSRNGKRLYVFLLLRLKNWDEKRVCVIERLGDVPRKEGDLLRLFGVG